jgi:putative hydrolase of the HAD superfamily
MKFDLIGFDADDTLWQTEIHYIQEQQSFEQLVSLWGTPGEIDEILYEIEIDNLPRYGIKAFVLSMNEAAIRISGSEIRGEQIKQVLEIDSEMLEVEVVLRPSK